MTSRWSRSWCSVTARYTVLAQPGSFTARLRYLVPYSRPRLLRAVQPIARVAEAGDDESPLVQAAVLRCADDVHVRIGGVHLLDSLRCGDHANERDRAGTRLL